MRPPSWSAAEDDRLRHLLAAGRTRGEIGEIMPGRTFEAVRARIHLLGLKSLRRRPDVWPAERDELLRHLWCVEGLSASKIAVRMPGLTPNAIIGRVHRLGMSSASRAESTRTQMNRTPKAAVEHRAAPKKGMTRFGNQSISKSTIPMEMPAAERRADGAVTLLERAPHQCGWPVNDGGPFLFCGAAKSGHKRYCDAHALKASPKGRVA